MCNARNENDSDSILDVWEAKGSVLKVLLLKKKKEEGRRRETKWEEGPILS